MKKIKIAYTDCWKKLNPDTFIITQILRKRYDVELVSSPEENPDFVFCFFFGSDYLKYSCPRILFTGEAICPDFNVYDYGIGFERMSYSDRYLRYPLYLLDKEGLNSVLNKHTQPDEYFLSRKEFCCMVVSNDNSPIRNKYFDKISEYKKIASGGRYRNNLPDGKPVEDKDAFQRGYRFCLCFENSSMPGYATEKIIDAYKSGCIPIYYGDKDIEKEFNPRSFIHVKGKVDFEETISRIKEIENDREKYLEMCHAPAVPDDSPLLNMMKDDYLEEFLYNIIDQNPSDAIRRHSALTMWGKAYEQKLKKLKSIEENTIVKGVTNIKRKLIGRKKL